MPSNLQNDEGPGSMPETSPKEECWHRSELFLVPLTSRQSPHKKLILHQIQTWWGEEGSKYTVLSIKYKQDHFLFKTVFLMQSKRILLGIIYKQF